MKYSALYIALFCLTVTFQSCTKDAGVSDESLTIDYEFTDTRDGKVYGMIKIGDQYWMSRNLDYTATLGISSYYDNDSTLGPNHGQLYDYVAALNAVPDGWHLPTFQEWSQLMEHCGGQLEAGGEMKSESGNFWNEPNVGATNEVGFEAHGSGVINGLGSNGWMTKTNFWSATEHEIEPDKAYTFSLSQESAAILFYEEYKYSRFSVRCIRD